MPEERNLRYLEAARVESDGVRLGGIAVEVPGLGRIGNIDGVIVEPGARRLRYFVIATEDRRRYLMPLEPMRLDTLHPAVEVVSRAEPEGWTEFDPQAFDEFDDNDLVAALFSRTR
jgi:hypothetical protein